MKKYIYASILLLSAFCGKAWGGGSVSGVVLYQGDIPIAKRRPVTVDSQVCGKEAVSEDFIVGKHGGLKNAVVYLEGPVKGPRKMEVPEGGYVVDQIKCRFEPHVSVVPVGASLKLMNSDPTLHNFHTYSRTNPSQNRAQLKSAPPLILQFDRPEIFNVKCDVHSWMSLWVVVAENPYYMVTEDDGRYRLQDIPAGDYNLVVWQESLGTKVRRISVKEGEDLIFDVMLSRER